MKNELLTKPKVILLDVYETLLDMTDVRRKVNDLLDSKRGYVVWFELLMQYCFLENSTAQFHDFPSVARATLLMAAKIFDRNINEYDADEVLETMKHLPLHEDVQKSLSKFYDKQYRIAALTNSSERIVGERMHNTGLISYFESVISAESVKKYKPALEVYEWAIRKLAVPAKEILLVSAHSWDIAGAAHAGMQTAFIQQGKQMLYPLAPEPDYLAKSLPDLVTQIENIFGTTAADKEVV